MKGRPLSNGDGPAAAVERAITFLERRQLASGEFPVLISAHPEMAGECLRDPSIFPTALMSHALSFAPSATRVRARAADFLQGEMDGRGLWRHWTRDHAAFHQLPPDLDDTACASAVLARESRAFPSNRSLLLANRSRDGLFHTWLSPRLRWTTPAHMRVTLGQLRHAPTLYLFFTRTSAKPYDIDAVVNANVLFYLGVDAETERVVAHLVRLLQDEQETQCDKWYDNPFAIWYFFSRALAGVAPEAGAIIAHRILAARPSNSLETALSLCSLGYWQTPFPDAMIARLLSSQLPTGGWPKAALYHGGRTRRRDGSFAEPHPDTPHWGSEELTTAFCIEAISRWQSRARA